LGNSHISRFDLDGRSTKNLGFLGQRGKENRGIQRQPKSVFAPLLSVLRGVEALEVAEGSVFSSRVGLLPSHAIFRFLVAV
jgi:hypothetical protein